MQMSGESLRLAKDAYENCIGCKACMKGCPMLHLFCENPKDLLRELAESGTFETELPYTCMLCRYCTAACPTGVDIRGVLFSLRRDTADHYRDVLPKSLRTGPIATHQRLSFSKLLFRQPTTRTEVAFFPGCGLQAQNPTLVKKVHRFLDAKMGGVGFVNACCGKPTQFLGIRGPFENQQNALKEMFRASGIRKVITGCQNCFMTLREQGEGLQVESLYETLSKEGGVKPVSTDPDLLTMPFTLHDPCPTRFHPGIHEGVRNLLQTAGFHWVEMPNAREKTLCCGAGGAVPLTAPEVSQRHTKRRAQEAHTDWIVTYCRECVESMREGGKHAVHVLDLLFEEDPLQSADYAPGLLKKWANRIGMRSYE